MDKEIKKKAYDDRIRICPHCGSNLTRETLDGMRICMFCDRMYEPRVK